ncbi:MAG: hypothetical protein WC758_07590 [Candidatus Woesearchaeota archaeon]|jgi:hypothetical protein
MNSEIIKEIERELEVRKQQISALGWLEFWDTLEEKLSKEELETLHNGIERIKLEKKIEGFNIGISEAVEFIDNQIASMKDMLKCRQPNDSSYSFLDKQIRNWEKLRNAINDKKVKDG